MNPQDPTTVTSPTLPTTPQVPVTPTSPTSPNQPYNYQGAISAGANPSDVINYLAKQTNYNAQGALSAGANPMDVLAYMSKLPRTAQTTQSLQPTQPTAAQTVSTLGKNLANDTNAHAANIVNDFSNKPSFTGALDVMGNVAGEVGNLITDPIKAALSPQVKDSLKSAASSVAGTPAAQAVINAWNTFSVQHPDAAKNIGNVVNIASLFGGAEAEPAVTDAAASVAGKAADVATGLAGKATDMTTNVGTSIKNAIPGIKNVVVGGDSTLPEVVGKITQASPDELPAATRALKSVDLTGSKTFSDISTKLDNAIKANTATVDSKLGASKDLLTPYTVDKTIPVKGGTAITTNPVNDSLKQLSDFYTKTNNPEALAGIKELEAKFTSSGLTPKEVNDIARLHGQVLNAYNANGELASGLSRQAAENTRTALKGVARDAMPDAATQAIDKNTSDLIKTKGMVDEMSTKVQALENKLKSFTPLQRAGQFAGKAVNVVTGGALKTFIKGLTGFGMDEGTTLNALQLQDSLAKNLKLLDKLNGMSPESAAKKVASLTATK